MKFDSIDLEKGGNIRYSLGRWARNRKPFLSIVHLEFSGDYRTGSSGHPDANSIQGTIQTVDSIWSPSAIILDLRALHYKWGDEMDLVIHPPKEIVSIVVGPNCEPAISTLFYGIKTNKSVTEEPYFFDSFDAAVDYVRQQLVSDWNSKVEQRPDWLTKADMINIEDLQ